MSQKRTWFEVWSQVGIFASAFSILLLGSGHTLGFTVGLLAQPCWYYTAYHNRQWGLMGANVIYTFGYSLGIYRSLYG